MATTLNRRGRRSLEEALLTLRSWSDSGDFPDLVCRSLATLLGGPAALYCIPEKGKGQRAVGAVHGFELARLFTTPFLRQGLVTDPIFKSSDENNGAWVKSNQSVMGDELADDAARWRLLRSTFLEPLGLADNLRVILTETDGDWLGWCGVFSPAGAGRFRYGDGALLDALSETLRDGLQAWHTLAPAYGEPLWILRDVRSSHAPVFAYTATGLFLMANAACRACYPSGPPWLADALAPDSEPAPGWDRLELTYGRRGRIFLFARRAVADSPCLAEQLARAMKLKPRYSTTALGLFSGLTNAEIVDLTELSRATVDGYVKDIMRAARAGTRGELIYEACRRYLHDREDPWPVDFAAGTGR